MVFFLMATFKKMNITQVKNRTKNMSLQFPAV